MADTIDQASEYEQRDRDIAIAKLTRPKGPGADECDLCGEAISALRKGMGATLCIHCQSAREQADRQRAKR